MRKLSSKRQTLRTKKLARVSKKVNRKKPSLMQLSDAERVWLKTTFCAVRSSVIKKPQEYVAEAFKELNLTKRLISKDVSNTLFNLNQKAQELYRLDEIVFTRKIHAFMRKDMNISFNKLEHFMLYADTLSSSTDNFRKSFNGKTFEEVIKYVMTEVYGYPYETQKRFGIFSGETKETGKLLDGVIPSVKGYEKSKKRSLLLSVKTTLRERWQQTADEALSTGARQISLLTTDDKLSVNTLNRMRPYNISVVTYKWNIDKLKEAGNVISFDEFFNKEVPSILN